MSKANTLLKLNEATDFKKSTKELFGDVVKWDRQEKKYYVSSPNAAGYSTGNNILTTIFDEKGKLIETRRISMSAWNSFEYAIMRKIKELIS